MGQADPHRNAQTVFFLKPFARVRLWLIILIIHTRFPFYCDAALARQVTKLVDQRIRFDVNP